jgi:hypothetical protein
LSNRPEAEFLDEIQTQVLRSSCYSKSPLYSFALRVLFLKAHETSYRFLQSVAVHCKGERRKTLIENHSYGLRNPYRNLKSENSQDYVHEFGFWRGDARCPVME